MKIVLVRSLLGLAALLPAALRASEVPPRHVVVVVFDGMRPDFISEQKTPNLWRLSRQGTFFAHQHPVYCSATEVNGTAMATGKYPAHSFVISNKEYRPGIDAEKEVGLEKTEVIRRGDEVSGGRYLGSPTVAEILRARGWASIFAGAKPVALLHDRNHPADGAETSAVLFEGDTLPASLLAPLRHSLGEFPPIQPDKNKVARDAWTTHALLGHLWQNGVPPYTLLWLAEPDISQHFSGVGSPQSLAGIKSSDANLGLVLADLESRGLRASTDVFVISDHGFSTIGRKVDVAHELAANGFHAVRKARGGLQPAEVIVVSGGGTTLLYVGGHDAATIRRLVAYVQLQDWAGVLFTRDGLPGTFPLAAAHVDSPEAPDLMISLRWNPGLNAHGIPGLVVADKEMDKDGPLKVALHASLSPYDMHNMLVAAGPDILAGFTDPLASGNVDLAPTVLWLLGLKAESAKMDGRVLTEALTVEAPPIRTHETKRLTAEAGRWTQYLQVSEVNGVRYMDEGNGSRTP